MRLNKDQRNAVFYSSIVQFFVLLLPPWVDSYGNFGGWALVSSKYISNGTGMTYNHIDFSRLSLEFLAVAVFTIGIVAALGRDTD